MISFPGFLYFRSKLFRKPAVFPISPPGLRGSLWVAPASLKGLTCVLKPEVRLGLAKSSEESRVMGILAFHVCAGLLVLPDVIYLYMGI